MGDECDGCASDRARPRYAIRGTPHRCPLHWVAALDLALSLAPATLVPSHTRPLHGDTEVRGVLTAYRWGGVHSLGLGI